MPMVGRATAAASSSRRSTRKISPQISPRVDLKDGDCVEDGLELSPGEEQESPAGNGGIASEVSPAFANFMSFVIVLSAVRLGIQCQWPEDEHPSLAQVYLVADTTFSCLFVAELLIKWLVLKDLLLRSIWNVLDVVITAAGVCEMCVSILPGHIVCHTLKRVSMLRFLRIFRLIRVLKGIDELVVVVDGIIKAMEAVAWVFLLLLVIMYMFAVFITMEIGRNEELAAEFGDVNYFGDLGHSMLTLLDVALLAEWPAIVRPIMHHCPSLLPLLLLFMMISTFGVMNILIGVIVDETAEARLEKEMSSKREHLEQASMLWKDVLHRQGLGRSDLDRHKREGTADMAELLQRRHAGIHQVVQLVLDTGCIDFPAGLTPEDVVSMLDFDGNNEICHEEFMSGLGRLLLGNEFQLTCLVLTMLGKMRKETRTLVEDVQEALEQDRASMDERIQKIEEKIWLKLQTRSAILKKDETISSQGSESGHSQMTTFRSDLSSREATSTVMSDYSGWISSSSQ